MDILRKSFRNRFIVLTLCFTIIFSSLNLKRSYAMDLVVSPTVLAVVSTLAVGTGIALKNSDDIYDLGRTFYEYVQNNNKLTWSVIQSTFEGCKYMANGMISVSSDALEFVKDFFDNVFGKTDKDINFVAGTDGALPYFPTFDEGFNYIKNNDPFMDCLDLIHNPREFTTHGVTFVPGIKSSRYVYYSIKYNGSSVGQYKMQTSSGTYPVSYGRYLSFFATGNTCYFVTTDAGVEVHSFNISSSDVVSLPYGGTYDWDNNIEDKKQGTGDLPLPIPGNLGGLIGKNPSDIWSNKDGLLGDGSVSIPSVDNPSIGVSGQDSFVGNGIIDSPTDIPGVENPPVDVPSDGVWATIKDFIISLVVPSDTFWTDTWNDLYNNFTGSFPGVDMGGFNDLVTGEKKFPNIDINIMGVKGRVVNGDVINSIVDWLRPIIAGFMMLCLMFFNYRKIYKLIRNSEPFGGIAPGTSDFSTGISEYSDNYLNAKHIIGENLRSMTGKGVK